MEDNTDGEPITPGTTIQDPGPANHEDPGSINQQDSRPTNQEDSSATIPSTLVDSPSSTLEPSGLSLDDMTDLVLFNIGANLQGLDFVNFTESSPRIFSVFEDLDLGIWKRRLQDEGIGINLTIKAVANALLESGSARTSSIHRLIYSMHFRTLDNMKRGVYKKCSVKVDSDARNIHLMSYDLITQTAKDSVLDFEHINIPHLVVTGSLVLIRFYEDGIYRWVCIDIQDEKPKILWEKRVPHLPVTFKTKNCVTFITYGQANIEIKGYNFRTGDEVFNFTLTDNRLHEWYRLQQRATCEATEVVDSGNWVVFSSKNVNTYVTAFKAIDTENKSLKDLAMPNPEIELEICLICQDHLCAGNNSKVFVWNLPSGQLIKEFALSTVINFNKISYFDPDMNQFIVESKWHWNERSVTYIKIDGQSQMVHTMPNWNDNTYVFGFSHMVRFLSYNNRLQVWPSSNPDQIINFSNMAMLLSPTIAISLTDEMSFIDFLDIDNYRQKI